MKQIKNKVINLKGIERNANDINAIDGACDEIINLRFKDGSWRPLGSKVEVNNFTPIEGYESFTNIYRHNILPEDHFIAKDGDTIILIAATEGVNPESKDMEASQSEENFIISIYVRGEFTIEKDQSWISLSKESGEGADSVTVTIDASSTANRNGSVTVTGDSGVYVCNITQEGIILTATTPVNVDYHQQDEVLDITILPSDADFTSTENPASDLVTSLSDDQGTNQVTASLAENPAGSPRSGTVRITHDDFPSVYQDVVINQEAAPFTIVCTPDSFLWAYDDNHVTKDSNVDIVPDATFAVNVTGDTTKFSILLNQTTNVIEITNLEVNTSGSSYQINIEVTSSGYTPDDITCTQPSS